MNKQAVPAFHKSDQSVWALRTSLMDVAFPIQIVIHQVTAMYTHEIAFGASSCVKYVPALI